jgi:hypothetical protein
MFHLPLLKQLMLCLMRSSALFLAVALASTLVIAQSTVHSATPAAATTTAQGAWSTAQISVARSHFAATSVGNVAIFAGGSTGVSGKSSYFLFE